MPSQIIPLFPESGLDAAKLQQIPVSTVDPTNGQTLVYNSTTRQYEPATPAGGGSWGSITGTLSAQTDLQSALDAKASVREIKTSSFTAAINGRYTTSHASVKVVVTDPSGTTAGQIYSVLVGLGTMDFGSGTIYSASRMEIVRYFNGSSWSTLTPTLSDNITLNGTSNTAANQTAASGSSLMTRDLVDAMDTNPRVQYFRDDFTGGARTAGIIGEGGWLITGTGATAVERGSLGVFPNNTAFRLSTGTTSTNRGMVYTYNNFCPANLATFSGVWEACFIFAPVQTTNCIIVVGFSRNATGSGFDDKGIGIKFFAGTDTNYQFMCKNETAVFGSTTSATTFIDSGIAPVANTFVKFEMKGSAAGTVSFRINGGSWVSTSSNIPTSAISGGWFWVETRTTAAASLDMDFAAWKVETAR